MCRELARRNFSVPSTRRRMEDVRYQEASWGFPSLLGSVGQAAQHTILFPGRTRPYGYLALWRYGAKATAIAQEEPENAYQLASVPTSVALRPQTPARRARLCSVFAFLESVDSVLCEVTPVKRNLKVTTTRSSGTRRMAAIPG